MLAVAIAFGSRFSAHPIINDDREECMGRDEVAYGAGKRPPRSRIVQLLVIRAREVVEAQKTYRIGNLNNVQVLFYTEFLVAREWLSSRSTHPNPLRNAIHEEEYVSPVQRGCPSNATEYYPHNLAAAVKHVKILGYGSPKALEAFASEKEKSAAVSAWWLVCIWEGFRSIFHRLRPSL